MKVNRIIPAGVTTTVVVILDQFTKNIAVKYLNYGEPREFIGVFVRWTYIRNPNSLFGISLGEKFPYEFLSVIVVLLILYFTLYEEDAKLRILYGVLMGGAIGNLIDRIRFSEVIDFIDIGITKNIRWPIFNIADSCVSLGVLTIIVLILRDTLKRTVKKTYIKNGNTKF